MIVGGAALEHLWYLLGTFGNKKLDVSTIAKLEVLVAILVSLTHQGGHK